MISFFAPNAHYFGSTKSHRFPHLQRGSSMIRAEQIARYAGWKYNSKRPRGVRIHIKPINLDKVEDGDYVDNVDSRHFYHHFKRRPKVKVIVCSHSSLNYLKKRLKNEIIMIPQQHCNFENEVRTRKEIKVVGMIGSPDSFTLDKEDFKEKMKEIGMEFITEYSYKTRNDVADFYKKIDIQVSWNTWLDVFKNPLRIINAASFGIPTIAFPEIGFQEFPHFIPVLTPDQMIEEIKKLKNGWDAESLIEAAKTYHISNIVKKYEELV